MTTPTLLSMQALADAYRDVTKLFIKDPMHFYVRDRLEQIEETMVALVENVDKEMSETLDEEETE